MHFMESEQDYIFNEIELIEFIKECNNYVEMVEKAGTYSQKDFIFESLKSLSLLYSKFLLLPDYQYSQTDIHERFISEDKWIVVNGNVAQTLAEKDELVELQDAYVDRSIDYIKVSLSELYADIYQDIGNILFNYKLMEEESFKSAFAECKDNFEKFWGVRVVKTIENLHRLLYNSNEEFL